MNTRRRMNTRRMNTRRRKKGGAHSLSTAESRAAADDEQKHALWMQRVDQRQMAADPEFLKQEDLLLPLREELGAALVGKEVAEGALAVCQGRLRALEQGKIDSALFANQATEGKR